MHFPPRHSPRSMHFVPSAIGREAGHVASLPLQVASWKFSVKWFKIWVVLQACNVRFTQLVITLHLNGKNLSNNSSWDFEPIFDTRNSYGLCPGQNCFSRSLVFFVNPSLVKWHSLKQTKTQNGHLFFSSTFHNQKLCSLAKKDSFTLKALKMELFFGWD